LNSTLSTVAARADSLAQAILGAVGADDIVSIFAGGSAASGDIAAYDTGERIEIYSDIDLYVVVRDGCGEDTIRDRVMDVVAAFDDVRDSGRALFVAPSDVGVYAESDIVALVPRPGTVCLHGARVLFGGEDVVRAAPNDASSIEPYEALYLIENRMTEMAVVDERRDAVGKRYAAYYALKLCADVGIALLVADRRFSCSPEERKEALASAGSIVAPEDMSTIVSAHAARRDLQSAFAAGSMPDVASAKSLALSAWIAIARHTEVAESGNWIDAMERRCRKGKAADNLREFVALRSRQGHGKLSSFRMAVGLGGYSPVSALRMSALARLASVGGGENARRLEEIDEFVGRLTRRCGFGDGTLSERVMNMNRSLR